MRSHRGHGGDRFVGRWAVRWWRAVGAAAAVSGMPCLVVGALSGGAWSDTLISFGALWLLPFVGLTAGFQTTWRRGLTTYDDNEPGAARFMSGVAIALAVVAPAVVFSVGLADGLAGLKMG